MGFRLGTTPPEVVTPTPEIFLDAYSARARTRIRRLDAATCLVGSVADQVLAPDSRAGEGGLIGPRVIPPRVEMCRQLPDRQASQPILT